MYQRPWNDLVGWVRVDDRHLSVVWRDGRVTLIDVPTGRIVWKTGLPDGPAAEAGRAMDGEWHAMWELSVAGSGIMVVPHDGRVDALDTRTGATVWSRFQKTSCGPIDGVRGVGEVVVVNHQCGKPQSFALGAGDRSPRWRVPIDPLAYIARDIGRGLLVNLDEWGGPVVRGTADGKVIWRDPAAGLRDGVGVDSFGVTAELLLVDTPAGIVAYRVADGSIAWRRPLDRPAGTSDAVLTDGRVAYVRGDERTVVKLDARTGEVIDRRRFEEEVGLRVMRGDLAVVTVGIGDDRVVG
ncbi:PQQ-binding-like beta-propeller repeat protein [Nonomuraea sp. NPDC050643]|uniref:outer membrane protein assembly factor BamB family protein n=1 Tax=Nonomuraea sp. NPDC050643 TaxID=3155660 RepID=UPI0033CBB94A